jgi:hypothetical protein
MASYQKEADLGAGTVISRATAFLGRHLPATRPNQSSEAQTLQNIKICQGVA